MADFILKALYLIAYPALKLFKPELTTYDVKDVSSDNIPTDAIAKILGIGLSTSCIAILGFWIIVTLIYKAPQVVYDATNSVISSDESSPLVQDQEFVEDTNKILTPKSNDVQYIEKPKAENPQDEVDALKEKLRKQKEDGDS